MLSILFAGLVSTFESTPLAPYLALLTKHAPTIPAGTIASLVADTYIYIIYIYRNLPKRSPYCMQAWNPRLSHRSLPG